MAEPVRGAAADEYPLSFSEELLWLGDRSRTGPVAFLECPLNMSLVARLENRLDAQALQAAFEAIAQRHAVLRSRFHERDARPVRALDPEPRAPLAVVDLRGRSELERGPGAQRLLAAHVDRGFDLEAGPPWRLMLLRLHDEEHILAVVAHHIVFDASSRTILAGELEALYGARTQGLPDGLPALEASYLDYVTWQRARLQGDTVLRLVQAWRTRLGSPPELRLPADGGAPEAGAGRRAGMLRFDVRGERVAALRLLGRRHSATPAIVTLALFTLLLHRIAGARDIVVGMPVSDRRRREFEDLIGLFTNVMLVRTVVAGEPTFVELLGTVRQAMQEAVAQQELPYACFVRLQSRPAGGAPPVPFRVAFNFMSRPVEAQLRLHGLRVEPLEIGKEHPALADLSLHVLDRGDALACQFVYRSEMFSARRIESFAEQFTALTSRVVAAPGRPIGDAAA